ncbi:hypothetical protein BCR39DRAFT_467593, partial [Naematelia encephala]
SGGWLADLIPPLSEMTGLWDFFLLALIYIAAWMILRSSEPGTSLILAKVFDLTIPLQCSYNPHISPMHKGHLDAYWPVMMFASLIEFGCFLLITPELFSLFICLKTTLMTTVWLGRRADGTFVRAPHHFSFSLPCILDRRWPL